MKFNEDYINEKEAKVGCLVDQVPEIWDDPDDGFYEDSIRAAAGAFESIADEIEDQTCIEKLKKVFVAAPSTLLEDYVVIIKDVCAWIRGVAAEAEDYAGEEDGKMMIGHCFGVQEWIDSIIDNVVANEHEWHHTKENEEYNRVENVLDNWNAICKALTGKIYNSDY